MHLIVFMRKKEDWDNNRIIFLDQSGQTVYEITEEMGLIYNSIFLTNAKVYYIDNSYNLVEVNLENSHVEKRLSDVGCFCISNDNYYICVGKIFSDNRMFYTTCVPELFILNTFQKIEIEQADYSFLENEFGISTYITFMERENNFEISYNWESVEPLFLLQLDITSKKIKKIK